MSRMESPTRTTTASVPLSDDRLNDLEAYCDTRDISKAEALRRGIDAITDRDDDHEGRMPPTDDDLAKAWKALVRVTSGGGEWVRQDRAQTYLAQRIPDYDKSTVYGGLLRPLQQQGYVRLSADSQARFQAVYVHE